MVGNYASFVTTYDRTGLPGSQETLAEHSSVIPVMDFVKVPPADHRFLRHVDLRFDIQVANDVLDPASWLDSEQRRRWTG